MVLIKKADEINIEDAKRDLQELERINEEAEPIKERLSENLNKLESIYGRDYRDAIPSKENIAKINKLYDEGNKITYYTARGSVTGLEWYEVTKDQLEKWGCKYHNLSVGEKPHYDLLICDKTKRIEEI